METPNKNSVGLTFGVILGGFHALWALTVLCGWAQAILNWIFWLHFIQNPYIVMGFGWKRAGGLVIFTFAVGYVVGWVGTAIWNKLVAKAK